MRSSLRRFHKKRFFMHLYFEYSHEGFEYQLPLFCMVVNILCSHAFSAIIGLFFRGRFCINHTRTRRKVPENKVSKQQDFISKDFLFRGFFFHGTFLVPKFRTLFPKTFLKNFFGGYRSANGRKSKKLANSILTLKALT